jgi:hypothetical protein
MAYYSVLIISKGGLSRYGFQEYEAESVYFGEDETMMRVKFFDAVRKAASMPKAVSVVVRSDLEELARVYIEH